jgi:hypothetical protein
MNEKDIITINKIKDNMDLINKEFLPNELLSIPGGIFPYIISSQFLMGIMLLMLEENGCSNADIQEKLNELKILSKNLDSI